LPSIVVEGARLYDGSGQASSLADMLIVEDRISAV